MTARPRKLRVRKICRLAIKTRETRHGTKIRKEQQAEKEREPAQRFLAAFLERDVIDLIDPGSQHIKNRHHRDSSQDRIDPERRIGDVRNIGAENDEGRMGDVDDIQNAERQGHA
jgi:hypothetical protein